MADEELKLSVTLDNQASAALAALQAQLQQLSNVATQATTSFQNLPAAQQRQARQSQQVAREASQEMGRLSYAIGFIGGAVGGAVSELTKIGIAFLQRATDVKAYSQSLTDLSAKSYSLGTNTAQFKANMEALGDAGIPKPEAMQMLEGFMRRRSELMREGSAAHREFVSGDEDGKLMDLRNQLIEAKEEDAFKIAVDFAKKQYDLTIERGHGEVRAAAVLRANLERLNIDPRAINAVLRTVSQAEDEFQKKRDADAKRYTQAINQQQTSLGGILDTMMAISLAVGGISTGTEGLTVWTNAVLGDLKGWETALRNSKDQSIPGLIQATIEWGRQTNTVVGAEIGAFARDVANISADLKAAYQWAVDVGLITPKPPPPPPQAGMDIEFDPFKKAPKDIELPTGGKLIAGSPAAKAYEYFFGKEEDLTEEQKRLKALTPGGFTKTGERAAGPLTTEALRQTLETGEPQGKAPPSGGASIIKFLQDWGFLAKTEAYQGAPLQPSLDPLTQYRQRQEGATEPGFWQSFISQFKWPSAAATAPQQFTSAATVGPATGQFTPDPNFLAGREAGVGVAGGSVDDRRAVEAQTTATKASTEEMQRLREAFAAFEVHAPPVPEEAPAPTIVQQETAPPVVLQQPAPAPTIVQEITQEAPQTSVPSVPQSVPFDERFGEWQQPQPQPQPAPFDERFGDWQRQSQLPSAFEGGVPFEAASAQSTAAGQTAGGWLQAAMLDRSRDVNVNGTGSISVDVRAPQGTSVKADSGGIFRKTEISRQVQMEPAEFGLLPTMG